MWPALEAIATFFAAIFAGVQIWLSRRDANTRAVLDYLREIDRRVQDAWLARPSAAQAELLAYYRGERPDLTPGAKNYMALLNSIDLLAFAVSKGLMDGKIAQEYLRTLLGPDLVSLTFLKELQDCCGDEAVYEHLFAHFANSQWAKPQLPSNS
jgi:hypothetical protein